MIAMLQKKWKNLPAALRTVLTLLAVLALAALLTTVRHNASAYRTGVWDTGSQTLIYGRMHQMEQGQRAPGGFLGVYTEDWSDDQNRSWFREDTPADAAQFRPYTHQSGLQGWALGGLNRLLQVLSEQHVDIEYMYSVFGRTNGHAYMIFRVSDPEGLAAIASAAGLHPADGAELGVC